MQKREFVEAPGLRYCCVSTFSSTASTNNLKLDTAFPWVLSNTPDNCDVEKNEGHTETPSILVRRYTCYLGLSIFARARGRALEMLGRGVLAI